MAQDHAPADREVARAAAVSDQHAHDGAPRQVVGGDPRQSAGVGKVPAGVPPGGGTEMQTEEMKIACLHKHSCLYQYASC